MKSEAIPIFYPPLGGPSDDEVEAARLIISQHKDAIKRRQSGALVRCTTQIATGKGCGDLHEISSLDFIQTHWYTSPYGCNGGDYWNQGEGQWVCPSCGHLNRLYENPDIEGLKGHFKSVVDKYD